jgi:hypothetical protein
MLFDTQRDKVIDEIITVTKLSAKSPFDLSMLEGLDLKDDDDLQDLAMLVKNNLNKLQRAIDLGNGKEANSILMAVRDGLNDLIALNRALARKCEDPVLKARFFHPSRHSNHHSCTHQLHIAYRTLTTHHASRIMLHTPRITLHASLSARRSPHIALRHVLLITYIIRYEAAADAAQKTLDEVIPAMADEVDKLLKSPLSSTAYRKLHHMIEDLQRAAHGMILVSEVMRERGRR